MDSTPAPLPVCAYDGHCYRKNPQHFHEYSHPTQYPTKATATPANTSLSPSDMEVANAKQQLASPQEDVADTLLSLPQKRCRSNDPQAPTVHDVDSESSDDEPRPPAEAGLASPELLLHFTTHAPHLSVLLPQHSPTPHTAEALPTGQSAALPRVGATHHWAGAALVLQQAYAGMQYHPADVRCVLTAACALQPRDPLRAFPGWRLVGPFELLWRYRELGTDSTTDSDAAAKAIALLHGRNAEEAARRWRCGRFRYDPPECQTVAVDVSPPTTTAGTAPLSQTGRHLCFHRDDPTEAPGMLVEGTAGSPKFTLLNVSGSLSAYLCAWYRDHGDAAALRIVQALEAALSSLSTGTPQVECDDLARDLQKTLAEQKRACARRSKGWVAPTYSRLGLRVPVDPKTDVGYREPNIARNVSFANCLRDCEADFIASGASTGTGAQAQDNNTHAAGAVAAAPFSRSIHHGRLAEARPFTTKISEQLDDIFLWADVANDEADFGTSLELGLNAFTCVLADRCVDVDSPSRVSPAKVHAPRRERERVDPVLWQTFRLLDCAYMLLQRPIYRHIFRCHLPLLANADLPVLLEL